MKDIISFILIFLILYLLKNYSVYGTLILFTLVPLVFKKSFNFRGLELLGTLIALYSLGYLQSYFSSAISISSLVIGVSQLLLIALLVVSLDLRFKNFITGTLFYLVLIVLTGNFTLDQNLGMNRILSTVGLSIPRGVSALFGNFSYSSMLFGSLGGISFYYKRYFSGFVFIVLLVLLDSRTAILSLPLALLITRKRLVNAAVFSGLLAIPLLLFFISFRNLEANILSYRNFIWASVITNYDPSVSTFLVGYGYLGQYSSGLSENYSQYFMDRGSEQALVMSTHNSLIQALLDYGILGLVFLIVSISSSMHRAKHIPYLLFPLAYLVISSGLEIVFIMPNLVSLVILFVSINEMKCISKKRGRYRLG